MDAGLDGGAASAAAGCDVTADGVASGLPLDCIANGINNAIWL